MLTVFAPFIRTYPALETLTEPHQLTATLSCMIGVARSLVSGGRRFPEGPTHMLPLLMRALPGVDPNDFSKCMVSHKVFHQLVLHCQWNSISARKRKKPDHKFKGKKSKYEVKKSKVSVEKS